MNYGDSIFIWQLGPNVGSWLRIQLVVATHWLNRSAGVA